MISKTTFFFSRIVGCKVYDGNNIAQILGATLTGVILFRYWRSAIKKTVTCFAKMTVFLGYLWRGC